MRRGGRAVVGLQRAAQVGGLAGEVGVRGDAVRGHRARVAVLAQHQPRRHRAVPVLQHHRVTLTSPRGHATPPWASEAGPMVPNNKFLMELGTQYFPYWESNSRAHGQQKLRLHRRTATCSERTQAHGELSRVPSVSAAGVHKHTYVCVCVQCRCMEPTFCSYVTVPQTQKIGICSAIQFTY